MALYLAGDIQGCLSELKSLLKQMKFNTKKDELWLVGDLVARGPHSLETLRFIKSLGESAKVVLGNHDLHLLATHAGLKKVKTKDNLSALLAAEDVDELMAWLAQQPLLRKLPNEDAYMSHAGISPQWTIKEATKYAKIAQQYIASDDRKYWLQLMYGESPNNWHDAKTDIEKFRYTINALTRMRYCNLDGSLEFSCKEAPDFAPKTLKPWFELLPKKLSYRWIFGHWAALMGTCDHKKLYALDTGCVWGNHLTLMRWEDKKLFTEKAHDSPY